MKALTFMQPWATLVAIGAKRIETRSWFTRYRGPLVIHAAKGFPKWAREFTVEPVCYEAVHQFHRPKSFPLGSYPLGAVLATCRLIDCVPTERMAGIWWRSLTKQERAFGDYDPGRYAWILDNVQQLAQPIPAKGALGLWEWKEVS